MWHLILYMSITETLSLIDSFYNWEYSLFEIEEGRIPFIVVGEFKEDMWSDDVNFSTAAILLKKENPQHALKVYRALSTEEPRECPCLV